MAPKFKIIKLDQEKLDSIEKDWLTTLEASYVLNLTIFSIRAYCNSGGLKAKIIKCSRGIKGEWRISKEDIIKFIQRRNNNE